MNQLELFPEELVEIHITLVWLILGGMLLIARGPEEKIRTSRVSCTVLQENFPSLLVYLNDLNHPWKVTEIITITREEWTRWTVLGTQTDWVFTSRNGHESTRTISARDH